MKIKVKDIEQLKGIIIKQGYSIRAFSKKLDISGPYGNQIVNGERNPSPKLAKEICNLIDVTFDDIFFIESGCNSEQGDHQSA